MVVFLFPYSLNYIHNPAIFWAYIGRQDTIKTKQNMLVSISSRAKKQLSKKAAIKVYLFRIISRDTLYFLPVNLCRERRRQFPVVQYYIVYVVHIHSIAAILLYNTYQLAQQLSSCRSTRSSSTQLRISLSVELGKNEAEL